MLYGPPPDRANAQPPFRHAQHWWPWHVRRIRFLCMWYGLGRAEGSAALHTCVDLWLCAAVAGFGVVCDLARAGSAVQCGEAARCWLVLGGRPAPNGRDVLSVIRHAACCMQSSYVCMLACLRLVRRMWLRTASCAGRCPPAPPRVLCLAVRGRTPGAWLRSGHQQTWRRGHGACKQRAPNRPGIHPAAGASPLRFADCNQLKTFACPASSVAAAGVTAVPGALREPCLGACACGPTTHPGASQGMVSRRAMHGPYIIHVLAAGGHAHTAHHNHGCHQPWPRPPYPRPPPPPPNPKPHTRRRHSHLPSARLPPPTHTVTALSLD